MSGFVRRSSLRMVAVSMAFGVLALTGCSSDEDDSSQGTGGTDTTTAATVAPNGETMTVLAVDNSFQPEELTIPAGTEVVWENNGRNDHNVIPEDEDAPWRIDAEDFAPGGSGSYVFTRPGTYRYYCSIHGTVDAGMPGVIVVE